MNLSEQDLFSGPEAEPLKSCVFALPLTPFFNHPGNRSITRTRGFNGKDFYLQFKNNGPFILPEDKEVYCGFDAYRGFTSVNHAPDPVPWGWTGSNTIFYAFDTDARAVTVQTDVVGRPALGNMWPDSATHATQGDPTHDPPDHVEITLFDQVNRDWLSGEFDRWMAQADDFREATGHGLGTYSYVGQGATRSESDGYMAVIGGGDVVARGITFGGTPWGMTGDEGDVWNGRFSAWVKKVVRKNAPALWREESNNYNYSFDPLAVGPYICREGYSEMELSEPLGDVWMDDYGVFAMAGALDTSPMEVCVDFYSLPDLAGDGKAHDLMLVSRTGERYRVTIQTGYTDYDGESPVWHDTNTHVVATDPDTFQVRFSFDEIDRGGWEVRVAKIEHEAESGRWETVSDVDAGGNPASMIGTDVVGDYLLLAVARKRNGKRFGFTNLDSSSPTSYYRKKTFRKHLTQGTVVLDDGGCGGGFTGSVDVEYYDEFSPAWGMPLPRQFPQRLRVMINGQDCTPEDLSTVDGLYYPDSSQAVRTATLWRWEGEITWNGRFHVTFDQPDPAGMVQSLSWVKVPMEFVAGENKASSPVLLSPPAAGNSLFHEGNYLVWP